MSDDEDLERLAADVGRWLQSRSWMLATAESCTGGWISTAVTAIAGSSEWFDRGFVTYSYAAKEDLLGVSHESIVRYGAVSERVVREMAAGALEGSIAQVALAVSGIAGPGGATPDKPVGTVCFAWAVRGGGIACETRHFSGDRHAVRLQTVHHALSQMRAHAEALMG